ncbi:hypothetical protein MKY59_12415 [Paenibacillus sp. FSL W8-0426]|uniref:hypothetical protein n=1 Tax=Paenibacillus sp. FSL W8-0426 TaxID=2921714 RepID=UPI0030DA5A31
MPKAYFNLIAGWNKPLGVVKIIKHEFAVFCRLSAKLINGIKGLKLTANSGCVRFLISEINVIFLVGIKIEAMREVANGGTSSDKQPFYSGTG